MCLRAYKNLKKGYSYLLVVADSFYKLGIVTQLRTKSAEEVSQAFNFLLIRPADSFTHRQKQRNQKSKIKYDLKFVEVKQIFGRARCLLIQEQVERFNQSIKRWISKTLRGNSEFGTYTNSLQRVLYNYNSSYHETTKKIQSKIFITKV